MVVSIWSHDGNDFVTTSQKKNETFDQVSTRHHKKMIKNIKRSKKKN